MPHERQRPTGEHLHLVVQRHLGQVHQSLLRPAVAGVHPLVPGVGGEVVDLASYVQDGVSQRVVLRGPVRVRDDDRIIINFSVWQDAESLFQYAFYSGHTDYYRRRNEWFTHEEEPYAVLWWVPAGHEPTVDEAEAKLAELKANGPAAGALTFKRRFPAPVQA